MRNLHKEDKRKISILFFTLIVVVIMFIFIGLNKLNYDYSLNLRLKKIFSIFLTGISIGTSTVLFQTVTNNRILTPSIIGLDSLYNMIQTLIVFLFGINSYFFIDKNINFALSTAVMVLLSVILFKVLFKNDKNIYFLLLIGVVFGTLFKSLSMFMQVLIDPNEFDALTNKIFASFNNINSNILFIAVIVLLLIIPFIWDDLKKLDVMLLGKDISINLGINYDYLTKKVLIIISILISISTALVGPITFLGLLSANITYAILRTYKHTYIILVSSIVSVIALLGGQLFVERILNYKSTVSIIINFIGGIYFIFLLVRRKEK
ncbi:iron chelate uptake ABC transporter family permease subunit [Clostridium thermobutyricum]|uniref:iron chelate uptake ABC transporter family permease subunit n=1 Tax=Clostridium thermobutyricum TaxID=29372 RepID=UPI0018AA210E|nr:iron chelate uptake ABC transporter family permease subunit [Clostridium thermobutyricum]